MTNDGDFANHVMHPSHEINKTYRVYVKKYSSDNFECLKRPIILDGYKIKAPNVQLIGQGDDGKAELLITIHEGRNRQVRRMCAAAGMSVVRLVRISEGGLLLGDLKTGKWRHLTEDEYRLLVR